MVKSRNRSFRTPRSGPKQGRKKITAHSRQRKVTSKIRHPPHKTSSQASPSRSFSSGRNSNPTYSIYDMRQVLDACGISLAPEEEINVWKHYKLLTKWNQIHNLTRIRNFEEIIIKHFVDSFLVADLVDLPQSLLDIGTGAGFPGIPLKIIHPETRIILAERIRKRVLFLAEVKKSLALTDLEIICRRIDRNFPLPVAGVITRAFGSIAQTLPKLAGCLLTGGVAMFMKGPSADEEIEAARRVCEGRYILERNIDYTLPIKGHKRRLLIYRRISQPE